MLASTAFALASLVTLLAGLQLAGSMGLLGKELHRLAPEYAFARNANVGLAVLLWLLWLIASGW
jgi:hypothetical protein